MVSGHPFPFRAVVLVADVLDGSVSVNNGARYDLERTHRATLENILQAIQRLGLPVYHYQSPRELAEHAGQHTNDIVLSIYGGVRSRNRMALVPAVCETFGLRFVGPDTYGRIVAQDKDISKSLAALAGLQVVPHRIVRSPEDLRWIDGFPVPYVVKPLFEGSSIGIEQCNLINAATEGPPVVRDLLDRYAQPIMVEQFIPGREVNWCFVECCDGPCAVFTELVHTVDPSFFENHLYDASLKLDLSAPVTITTIDNDLHPDDARMLKGLLRLVGHVGYGRIDGKLRNGRFVFLEFSALL